MMAAQTWAQGGQPIDYGPLEDLQLLRAPPAIIDALRARLEAFTAASGFGVWSAHWHAAMVFLGMTTQWRAVAGLQRIVFLGLDYAALPIIIEEYADRPYAQPLSRLMPRLRTMELAASAALRS